MNDEFDENILYHSTLESGEDFYIKDRWKKERHFKIASFPAPPGITSEAIEIKPDNSSGYIFRILSDFDADIEAAEEKLKKIISKKINKKQVKFINHRWEIEAYQTIEGRIEYNDDPTKSNFEKLFVIDGNEITIEEFIQMLEPYEGFSIQFKIIDSYENVF